MAISDGYESEEGVWLWVTQNREDKLWYVCIDYHGRVEEYSAGYKTKAEATAELEDIRRMDIEYGT